MMMRVVVGVLGSLGVASIASANVLTNPGFESPSAAAGDVYASANWNAFNDAYTTKNITPNSGTQALKVFGPFSTGGGAGVVQGGFAASPGQTWAASAFLRNDSTDAMVGSNFAVVKVEFVNASNVVITGFESPHFIATNPQNIWTPEVATGIAPAGTTTAQIVLVNVQLNSPVTAGSVFYDDASLDVVVPEPGSLAVIGIGAALALRRRAARSRVA